MRKSNPTIKAWEDGSHETIDILARIFRQLNMIDLVSVSQISHLWHLASSDPSIWSVLDLGNLKSNFIYITVRPYIWVDSWSDRKLTYILRIAMALSHGNITFMIFNYNLYLKDKHLSIIAEGCPNLKRLVLPAWNCLTKGAMSQAIERWSKLESLTMPSIGDPDILMEIGKKCKNFSQLKVMGSIDMRFASKIAGAGKLKSFKPAVLCRDKGSSAVNLR